MFAPLTTNNGVLESLDARPRKITEFGWHWVCDCRIGARSYSHRRARDWRARHRAPRNSTGPNRQAHNWRVDGRQTDRQGANFSSPRLRLFQETQDLQARSPNIRAVNFTVISPTDLNVMFEAYDPIPLWETSESRPGRPSPLLQVSTPNDEGRWENDSILQETALKPGSK
jgi:hypothetical protein